MRQYLKFAVFGFIVSPVMIGGVYDAAAEEKRKDTHVRAPHTTVDVDEKVDVRAPYTRVRVNPRERRVRVRAPYVNLDIRW